MDGSPEQLCLRDVFWSEDGMTVNSPWIWRFLKVRHAIRDRKRWLRERGVSSAAEMYYMDSVRSQSASHDEYTAANNDTHAAVDNTRSYTNESHNQCKLSTGVEIPVLLTIVIAASLSVTMYTLNNNNPMDSQWTHSFAVFTQPWRGLFAVVPRHTEYMTDYSGKPLCCLLYIFISVFFQRQIVQTVMYLIEVNYLQNLFWPRNLQGSILGTCKQPVDNLSENHSAGFLPMILFSPDTNRAIKFVAELCWATKIAGF